MKHCLFLLTQDREVIEDIQVLLKLFPDWELAQFTNVDKAWISFLTKEPDLSIVDLDMTGVGMTSDAAHKIKRGEISPLLVIISSRAISELGDIAVQLRAMDYLKKPIDLDRIVFVLSLATGYSVSI